VCLSLDPSYLQDLNTEDKTISLNYTQLMQDIAHEMYVEDFFNMGTNTASGQILRPDWIEYIESLD